LVEIAGLRVARVAIGGSAKERYDSLREAERGDGPVPGLGVLLEAIARDDDGEWKRALELVTRASSRRWGPPERAAIGDVFARHGARAGAALALDVLERAAGYPEDAEPFVRGAAGALATAHADEYERFGWNRGFQMFVLRDRALVLKLAAEPGPAKQIAKALFYARSQDTSIAAALEAIWTQTPRRDVWVDALADQTRGNYGMSGREEIVTWSWRRFCEHPDERRDLYRAFESWRDLWIEQRNAMPARQRPGGESAVAHLQLWGGLSVEHLSAVVEEVKRLARADEWPALVDLAFDLGSAAPQELRRHGLAGVCRIASEVANRIRAGEGGLDAAGERVIARGEALAKELRESGATLDEIVDNRANDLELEARLIRETWARDVEITKRAAEREAAQRDAEAARRRAEDEARRIQDAMRTPPAYTAQPIDDEVFLPSSPAPSLIAYARLYRRMTQPGGVQGLATEIGMEMIATINQSWSQLFSQRPELAMRFSILIAAI
jgi:hypothetical protein